MVNEIFLYLLGRLEHAEGCSQDRCAVKCEVAKFLDQLDQPLLAVDVRRHEREQKRLAALAKGEIPEAV